MTVDRSMRDCVRISFGRIQPRSQTEESTRGPMPRNGLGSACYEVQGNLLCVPNPQWNVSGCTFWPELSGLNFLALTSGLFTQD